MKSAFAAALAATTFAASAAPDEWPCDRLLKATSDREISARRAYLLSAPDKALAPMERAAAEFENYAKRCEVDRPLSYLGVLVHGRLSILYRKLGKTAASSQSAALALQYASTRAQREILWPDVEAAVAEADAKQKESLK